MTKDEAKTLKYFSDVEIAYTGAKINDVQYQLFVSMDKFRALVDRSVCLLPNGITTGNHKSEEHKNGLACDCYLPGVVDPYFVFKKALDAGFNRIGVYWNGSQYSFHLAIGKTHGFWTARKTKRGEPWVYGSICVDPAQST